MKKAYNQNSQMIQYLNRVIAGCMNSRIKAKKFLEQLDVRQEIAEKELKHRSQFPKNYD